MAETWDSIADWYAVLVRGGSAMTSSPATSCRPCFHQRATWRVDVLDVGCGEGILTRAIAVRGATVVGLDPTLRLITHAQSAEQAVPHPRFDAPSASSVIVDGQQRRVIGEYLAEGFWRSTHLQSVRRAGVASRAVDALTQWAFDDVGFHRLELTHSVHNLPSCRVAIKTGFDFEGVKRRAGLHLDGWHDMHLHARINDD